MRGGWIVIVVAAAVWPATSSAQAPGKQAPLKYPQTRTVDHVDEYHGVKVPDWYRWLEEDVRNSPEVAKWVESQNAVTNAYLEAIPQRSGIRDLLTRIWNFEKRSPPSRIGGKYYFTKNDGLQNQSVLFEMDRLGGEERVLLDPNGWSADGTVALADTSFSPSGKFLAYAIQDGGSDWRTWRIMNVASRSVLEDKLEWLKFSSVAWTHDERGVFYSRFEEPREGEAFQSLNLKQKIFYHRVGTAQTDDVLVYERPDHPEWGYQLTVTEDGRYLVITVWKGTADKYRVMVKDLLEPYGMPIDLITHFDDEYTFVGNDGERFFFKTDLNAPNRRVIAMSIRDPRPEAFVEVIPESDEALEGVGIVGNQFVVQSLKDASTHVRLFDLLGRHVRDVDLPGIGSAGGFSGRQVDTETFYSFSSFATPPSTYRYDLLTGTSELIHRAPVDFAADDYVVEQVFYQSADGTRVPMFVAHRKGLQLDGSHPTLLYAYGGFNISLTPTFSISKAAWMEMGGVFALANLRGGGEYGERWHQGGMKALKQNVFDDFIAAAEHLVSAGYTRPEKLAIQGGSNGGLLVGAVMAQRPELFGACLPAVGVMDMLRFQNFTAGRYWVDEFGSSEDPALFPVIYKYSPYHNLQPGTKYPATMVTTADTDDRVVPGHSFKFAARLQECQAGMEPALIRIETRAGHGSGKPTAMQIEEIADMWAFLVRELDMDYTPQPRAEAEFTMLSDGAAARQWEADVTASAGILEGDGCYLGQQYGNFVLRFEFKMEPAANSGMGIRCEQGQNAAYHGMEIQVLDDRHENYAGIKPWQAHGSIYGVVAAKRDVLKQVGQWNEEEIVADGDRIKVTVNGQVVVDASLKEAAGAGTLDGKPHPGLFAPSGYLRLCGHGGGVQFRNVRVRELP